jgi:quinol monooxygenase YgiN
MIRMIFLFVDMHVLPEKSTEVFQTLESMVPQIRSEEGCIDARFYQNTANDNNFILIESWENHRALKNHLGSTRFTVLLGFKSLLRWPPQILIHTVSSSLSIESD